MAELTMRELEGRLDRLETKVDHLDTKVDQLDTKVGQKLERMNVEIGEAFVEQRMFISETAASLRRDLTREFSAGLTGLRGELTDALDAGLTGLRGELVGMHGEIESLNLETTGRFDALEQKLDAFTGAQSVVNKEILARLERLDAQSHVTTEILKRLAG